MDIGRIEELVPNAKTTLGKVSGMYNPSVLTQGNYQAVTLAQAAATFALYFNKIGREDDILVLLASHYGCKYRFALLDTITGQMYTKDGVVVTWKSGKYARKVRNKLNGVYEKLDAIASDRYKVVLTETVVKS